MTTLDEIIKQQQLILEKLDAMFPNEETEEAEETEEGLEI